MHYVYVLRSIKNNKRYLGYTSKSVLTRLAEHNSGTNRWTRQNGPFELVYLDEFASIEEARDVEKFLKSGQGR